MDLVCQGWEIVDTKLGVLELEALQLLDAASGLLDAYWSSRARAEFFSQVKNMPRFSQNSELDTLAKVS